MRTVMIPTTENPWQCEINGIKYSYPAGTEQTVPDQVADLIGDIAEAQPKQWAEVRKAPAGSVLTYPAEGRPYWGPVPPNELPVPAIADNGKTVEVVSGAYALVTPEKELPSVGAPDNGMVLTVVSGVWAKAVLPVSAISASDISTIVNSIS